MKQLGKSKAILIGLIVLLVLAVIFSGFYYFTSNKNELGKPRADKEIAHDIFVKLVYYNLVEDAWIETKNDYQQVTVQLKKSGSFPYAATSAHINLFVEWLKTKEKDIEVSFDDGSLAVRLKDGNSFNIYLGETSFNAKLTDWLKNEGAIMKFEGGENSLNQIVTVEMPESRAYFVYTIPPTDNFMSWLVGGGVTPHIIPKFDWTIPLLLFVPPLLFIVVLIWIFKGQLQGLGKKFTKSKAKGQEELKTRYSFADVAGVEEAKGEVAEVVSFLNDPRGLYKILGATMPRGCLLLGPPGTGKSLLAKAAACEAGIPFQEASGSDFHEMFVGVGAARWRDLLEWAKKNAPSTLILDEIDSAAPKRTQGVFNDEGTGLTNAMLHGLSTIEHENLQIIIFAITNRPDMLDPALLRPGRLDRHIEVPLPDYEGRKAILKVHLERPFHRPIDEDFDINQIAKETRGFSGADLAALANEAAIRAARRLKVLKEGEKLSINKADFEEAILRVLMGPEKKLLKYRPIEKEILAWHEAGHALVAKLLPETDEVQFVTILPRGRAAGFTMYLPTDEYHIYTQAQIFNRIKMSLGGRAAEMVHFNGKVSTGAMGDIEVVNSLTRNAVCVYGMSKLGPISVPETSGSYWGSSVWQGETGKLAALEINEILRVKEEEVVNLLRANQGKLDALAKKLLEEPFIAGDRIDEIINNA